MYVILQYLGEPMKSVISMAMGLLLSASLLSAGVPAGAAGRRLVIIGWDTLRADHVSAIGYKRKTTPNLDALAARSVLFTNAISPASWTLPAFMSVFTSQYPSEHGVTNKFKLPPVGSTDLEPASLSTSAITMAQFLRSNGYRTAAFTGGAGVSGTFGFNRGFEVYSDSANFAGFDTTFPKALDWIEKNGDAPYFVFVHGYDTHPFHDLKADGAYTFITSTEAAGVPGLRARHEKMRLELVDGKKLTYTKEDVALWTDVYDEKILRADRLLGNFLKALKAQGGEEPVIILLADHGEELFDHGGVDHGMTLYDEMIHVPLIISVPGGEAGRVASQVRTLDIFPTVIDLLGLKAGNRLASLLRGVSLVPQMSGAAPKLDAFSETDYLFHFNKRSVRKADGMKLTQDGFSQKSEVYDTAADTSESFDLSEKDAARAYVLEMDLVNWGEGLPGPEDHQ